MLLTEGDDVDADLGCSFQFFTLQKCILIRSKSRILLIPHIRLLSILPHNNMTISKILVSSFLKIFPRILFGWLQTSQIHFPAFIWDFLRHKVLDDLILTITIQQERFVKLFTVVQSNDLLYMIMDSHQLIIKGLRLLLITYDIVMWMSNIGIKYFIIGSSCLLDIFIPRFVIKRVEFFRPVSSRNQMENSVVTEISEGVCIPTFLIEDNLPLLRGAIGHRIAGSSVTENHCGGVLHLGDF